MLSMRIGSDSSYYIIYTIKCKVLNKTQKMKIQTIKQQQIKNENVNTKYKIKDSTQYI